jgi:hypothetical protein
VRGHWSPAAKLLCWSVVAAQMAAIALIAPFQPWIWMLPLTLPFFALLIDDQYLRTKAVVASHLDAAARELKLVPVLRGNDERSPGKSPKLTMREPASSGAAG